jgi:hypothetical protein
MFSFRGIVRVGIACSLVFAVSCSRSSGSTSADAGSGLTLAQAVASGLSGSMQPGVNVNVASGHVESTGTTGAWTFDTGTCFSGDNDGYFGTFVKSKSDPRVWIKLVKDPIKQWTVGVSVPDTCKPNSSGSGQKCDVQYFDTCSKLDVQFKTYTFQGRRTGGGHQFDGTATFDCTTKDSHVSGNITVEKCSP